MPKAYLHIGAPKCASSLIQGLLNERDARNLVKPDYMDMVCRVIQSHTPCKKYEDYSYRQTLEEIKSLMPDRDCLFSIENIFGLMTHSENCYENSVRVIDHIWSGFDVKVFMYVRRQDTFLKSMYNQDVKRGETRTFEEYIDSVLWDNLHWDRVADNYSKYDLTVRPFEKAVLQTAGYEDFIDALFRWLGADVEVENLPVVNPSLSHEALEVQRLANKLLTEKQAYDFSIWAERHCPKAPEEDHDFWKNRNDVIGFYRESNKRLFREYLPEFSPEYYLGDSNELQSSICAER